MMYRHGDLLIERVTEIPTDATVRRDGVLAYGEATGHAHRLTGSGAVLERNGETYLRVENSAAVVHEEHNAVVLPAGDYRVVQQREWDPYEAAARKVVD